MVGRRRGAILGLLMGVGVAAMVATASPAAAELTTNELGCAGRATISGGDGDPVEVTSEDAEVTVPREGTIAWEGSIEEVTHNHFGEVVLEVGMINVPVGDWGPSENSADVASASGSTDIPGVLAQVPPGRYVVSGFHQGDEGRCAGTVIVEIGGSPLSTPLGLVAVAGTFVSALGLLFAAVARGPVPA